MSATDHMPWEDERAAYLLGALDAAEVAGFETHLAGCDRCRAELRWLQPAVDVLPASVEQVEPAAELRARILAAVAADTVNPAAGQGDATVADDPRAAGRDGSPTRPSLWSRLAPRPAFVALATVIALAIGLAGGYALNGSDEPETIVRTVPLEPTAPAVQATGNVIRHDDTWTLDVSDLPDLRPGDVYQVWMRKGKQLEPSVLFVPSGDGTARIVLPEQTGAANEMLVTREPSGGSQEPTSAPLVSATVQ